MLEAHESKLETADMLGTEYIVKDRGSGSAGRIYWKKKRKEFWKIKRHE